MNFSIDLPQGGIKDADDLKAVSDMFKQFMEDELEKAQETGIPI